MSVKFTILLSVHNGENGIEEAINSTLMQSFEDFELLISNNCSTDRTLEIINDYANIDQRIKITDRKENIGFYENLNRMKKTAKGEYITLLSHDDTMLENRLERILHYFEKDPNVHIFGNYMNMVDVDNKIIKQMLWAISNSTIKYCYLPFGRIGTSNYSMRKEVSDRFDFDTEYGFAGDYSFLTKVCSYSDYKISTIPEVLYNWKSHDNNYSTKNEKHRLYYPNIIGLRFLSKTYRVFIDPIIEKFLYSVLESTKVSVVDCVKAGNAINKLADEIAKKCDKEIEFRPEDALRKQFKFILKNQSYLDYLEHKANSFVKL